MRLLTNVHPNRALIRILLIKNGIILEHFFLGRGLSFLLGPLLCFGSRDKGVQFRRAEKGTPSSSKSSRKEQCRFHAVHQRDYVTLGRCRSDVDLTKRENNPFRVLVFTFFFFLGGTGTPFCAPYRTAPIPDRIPKTGVEPCQSI